MNRKVLFLLVSIIFQLFCQTPAISKAYAPDEEINITVYEKINPAIVSIDAQTSDGISAGTGCIVSPNGLILTGSHVVEDSSSVEVTMYNGQVYKAEIVSKMGKNKDLALLKITPKTQLQTIKFGDSQNIKVGQSGHVVKLIFIDNSHHIMILLGFHISYRYRIRSSHRLHVNRNHFIVVRLHDNIHPLIIS